MSIKIILALLVVGFSLSFSPRGGKALKEGLWLDKKPISVEGYDIYLHETKGQNDMEKLQDSAQWYSHYNFSIGVKVGFRMPTDRQRALPMIGLNQEQIAGYFAWRSAVASKYYGKEITYRLPTLEELQMVKSKERRAAKFQHDSLTIMPRFPKKFMYISSGPNELLQNGQVKKGSVPSATSFRGVACLKE